MSGEQVLRFEYQQSLSQAPGRPGWSEALSISVRLLSEAITSGWYRSQFGKHTSDFVVLVGLVMHARPLAGADLRYLMNLGMAVEGDEGRLYARVTDIGLADELGLHRQTIAAAAGRLAEKGFLAVLDIPEGAGGFRDSHGRFGGTKVYLLAGDLQQRFLQKEIQEREACSGLGGDEKNAAAEGDLLLGGASREGKTVMGWLEDGGSRAEISTRAEEKTGTNPEGERREEEEENLRRLVWQCFADHKGLDAYQPSPREQAALEELFQQGYTLEEIQAGMAAAFQRTRPRFFTLCARVIGEQKPGRGAPEAASAQGDGERGSPPGEALLIETALGRSAEILSQAGEALGPGQLSRLRLMARRAEPAARQAGSSGEGWVAEALARAVGAARPGSLIAYADAVLDDWLANGRPPRKKVERKQRLDASMPKGARGIAAYRRHRQGGSHGQ